VIEPTDLPLLRRLTFPAAVREALREEMRRDERVLLLGPYVRSGTTARGMTDGLVEEFGTERVLDSPIAEGAVAGIGAGAAMAGLRPVVRIGNLGYALSLLDQVCNQAAKAYYTFDGQVSVPVVFWFETAVRGWGVHHAQAIHALLLHLPGLKVVMPTTPSDAAGLLRSAIHDDNPVAYILHPDLFDHVEEVEDQGPLPATPIGVARVARPGSDVTVVTCGLFVARATAAAERLLEDGVSVEVIDLRSLVPLDWSAVMTSVERTGRVVVYDQGHRTSGLGVTVAAGIQDHGRHLLRAPVALLTTADAPVPYSLRLGDEVVPTTERLVEVIRECLEP
jgi:pyruvate dehydrogenase E1 component beta subunit